MNRCWAEALRWTGAKTNCKNVEKWENQKERRKKNGNGATGKKRNERRELINCWQTAFFYSSSFFECIRESLHFSPFPSRGTIVKTQLLFSSSEWLFLDQLRQAYERMMMCEMRQNRNLFVKKKKHNNKRIRFFFSCFKRNISVQPF